MEGDLNSVGQSCHLPHFYPRPHMEGDSPGGPLPPLAADFYPRPHMEGDSSSGRASTKQWNFYPRPHMEGDAGEILFVEKQGRFLPTPSHGGRHRSHRLLVQFDNFYPRPHMEGDEIDGQRGSEAVISTHALTWRATAHNPVFCSQLRFLPTPSHGGRQQTC